MAMFELFLCCVFLSKGHIIADPVGHFVIKGLIIAESKACESGQQLDRSELCHLIMLVILVTCHCHPLCRPYLGVSVLLYGFA